MKPIVLRSLFVVLFFTIFNTNAQQCLTPGNLLAGKGTVMFLKNMNPNRIVAGGVYYTSAQGVMTMASDTLHPRTGDVLTIFAAVLDSNLNLIRLFNVIGFTETGGSFNDTRVWDMHADKRGNIYFSGSYTQDTLISYFNDTIISDSYQEAFVIRCDSMGMTSLLKSCGTRSGTYKFEDRANSITSDKLGNIIFTVSGKGSYFSINGDTANATQYVGLNSYADIFIVSLHPDGSTRWIRNCGTPYKDDAAYDVDVNEQGEVSVCGAVGGSNTVFHFGSITHTFKYSQYGQQGFVGKLDSSGVPVWLSPIEVYYPSGPDVGAYATAIDDSGFVYSSGYFDAWAIFNGDTIRSLYSTNNYFSKYKLSGQTSFVKLGNIDTFYPFPIYMDENKGKVLITGQCFTNQLTFQQYGQCCQTEAYAVVYDTQGDLKWLRGAKAVSSSNPYFGMGCINENGTAFICGTGSGGIVELAPLQIPITPSKQYYIVKFAPSSANGLSLLISNAGNDTLSCGTNTQLIRTLVPSSGPTLTWWANNDTIASPNSNNNINASPRMTTLYIATSFYNGCVVSDSITVTVLPLPCFAGNDTAICAGQALSLQGNSISGASYSWSPSSAVNSNNTALTNFVNNLSTNLYYTISRNGCKSSDTLSVSVNPQTIANFNFSSALLNVNFSNSSLFYDSLYWTFGDGSPLSNIPNPSHTYAQNGIYAACLHTFNLCGSDSVCKTINLSTVSILELQENSTLLKTPNGYQLVSSKSIGGYAVYDVSGRCILKSNEMSNQLNLDLNSFEKGCYLLHYQLNSRPKKLKLIW